MNKEFEHYIQLVESGEDSSEAFEPAEQPFHLIALLVKLPVVLPTSQSISLGWYYRLHAQLKYQLTRFVALVSFIHNHFGAIPATVFKCFQELAAFRSISRLTGRQRKRYGSIVASCDHMNFGGPSAPRLADRLRTVFFNAPVPSGWTFTAVESSDTWST